MRQLFEQLARRQPLLLVIEDWHWADRSVVEPCASIFCRSRSRHLVLGSGSSPGRTPRPAARIRSAVRRQPAWPFQEIALVPLGEEHSGALVDTWSARAIFPRPCASEIMRKTEGNRSSSRRSCAP